MSGPGTAAEVDVWLLAEPDVPALAERLGWRRLLAADERARLARLRRPGSRRRYLGSRLLRRAVLAAATGDDPAALRFVTGPFGRPELAAGQPRFSLSHTDGLIAAVVTAGRPCGVDVEVAVPDRDVPRFGLRRLAPAERAGLAALDLAGAELASAFAGLWVLKEAYTKALGRGLLHRFDSFGIAPATPAGICAQHGRRGQHDQRRYRLTDPSLPAAEQRRWQLELGRTETGHHIGIAVRRDHADPPRLTIHHHPRLASMLSL